MIQKDAFVLVMVFLKKTPQPPSLFTQPHINFLKKPLKYLTLSISY